LTVGSTLLSRTISRFVSLAGTVGDAARRVRYRRADPDQLYRIWVREKERSSGDVAAQRKWSEGQARIFSLLTFVRQLDPRGTEQAAASVRLQSYPGWEWILVATDESMAEVRKLAARGGDNDRVRVLSVPSGSTRADAWNAALREAAGDFAAVLGERDVLSASALYEMARGLERFPVADVLYSDEDQTSSPIRLRHDPRFKPDWSPDLLLAGNYIGRLAMIRVRRAIEIGGFRNEAGDAEEWDLLLRLSRSTAMIRRVPSCLYHREAAIPNDTGKAEAVLQDHCRQLGLAGPVLKSVKSDGASRVVWDIQGEPTVSIVIPNRDAALVLGKCVEGLINGTSYPRRELVIVDNGSTEEATLDLYRRVEREGHGRILPFGRPFNFSAACNMGAAAARGDLLLFLNNDIEVIHPDWLDELVRWAQRPDVGIVGAKLLYPDRTIQHAGVVFGLGLVGHIFSRAAEGTAGLFGSAETYRNYLAVTGACQMMRKDVFQTVGGFDERFRLSFSDVVLCLEAWKAGLRVVYTPYARLVHHESYTRRREDSPEDLELLARYLRTSGFVEDPYCHPELNAKSLIPLLRPPFDPAPPQVVHDYVQRVLAAATH
jgi:GT2 family glycosyltransferase